MKTKANTNSASAQPAGPLAARCRAAADARAKRLKELRGRLDAESQITERTQAAIASMEAELAKSRDTLSAGQSAAARLAGELATLEKRSAAKLLAVTGSVESLESWAADPTNAADQPAIQTLIEQWLHGFFATARNPAVAARIGERLVRPTRGVIYIDPHNGRLIGSDVTETDSAGVRDIGATMFRSVDRLQRAVERAHVAGLEIGPNDVFTVTLEDPPIVIDATPDAAPQPAPDAPDAESETAPAAGMRPLYVPDDLYEEPKDSYGRRLQRDIRRHA
jgi:hypothetical protein